MESQEREMEAGKVWEYRGLQDVLSVLTVSRLEPLGIFIYLIVIAILLA